MSTVTLLIEYRTLSNLFNISSGPVGVGKSHILYQLVADLRMDRQKYRVTYINDCSEWRYDAYDYFLLELVMTFYDDEIDGKGIIQWCSEVIREVNRGGKQEMLYMMEALIKFTKEQRFQWVIVCDQHNALYNPTVVKEFPFNLITYLARERQKHIRIIVSASANNEGCPTEMQSWHSHDIDLHHFDDTEFKEWWQQFELIADSNDMKLALFGLVIFLYWSF